MPADQQRAGSRQVARGRNGAGDCPRIERHTAAPERYVAWHEWAERMSKTHRCTRCRTCGFYAVWTPKEAA